MKHKRNAHILATLLFLALFATARAQTAAVEILERGEINNGAFFNPKNVEARLNLLEKEELRISGFVFMAALQNTQAEITARVKQFETEYNTAANAATLGAHFTPDAVMLDPYGKKIVGADAIGHWHADPFAQVTCHLEITVDEVIELPGGYAFCGSHYVNNGTTKADGGKWVSKGEVTTLFRKEDGVWKIMRHTLVDILEDKN